MAAVSQLPGTATPGLQAGEQIYMQAVESAIISLVQWLRLAVEATGALVIAVGVITAIYGFGRSLAWQRPEDYVGVRQTLARYLALAIEFQLAADILSTAIAPSWDQIGKLGAIVVIRTGLNYFLMREMKEERLKVEDQV